MTVDRLIPYFIYFFVMYDFIGSYMEKGLLKHGVYFMFCSSTYIITNVDIYCQLYIYMYIYIIYNIFLFSKGFVPLSFFTTHSFLLSP